MLQYDLTTHHSNDFGTGCYSENLTRIRLIITDWLSKKKKGGKITSEEVTKPLAFYEKREATINPLVFR